MVPMPDDIGCTLKGMQIELSVDANGEAKPPRGSVKGITCWIEGNKPVKKDIPLASGTVKEGMLSTKQFGKIEITQGRDISADTLSMAIGSDKLTAFREYLQQ